jgi:hypothetical protein
MSYRPFDGLASQESGLWSTTGLESTGYHELTRRSLSFAHQGQLVMMMKINTTVLNHACERTHQLSIDTRPAHRQHHM